MCIRDRIKGADGVEMSVQEALESMPEGGRVNPDGTLEPVVGDDPNDAERPGGCPNDDC